MTAASCHRQEEINPDLTWEGQTPNPLLNWAYVWWKCLVWLMCVKQHPFSSDARNQTSHTLFNSANFWLQMRVANHLTAKYDANIWWQSFCKWVVFICGLGIFWKGQLKMKMSPSYHSAQCSLPQNNNCLCLIATYSPQLTWCSAKDIVLTSTFQGLARLFWIMTSDIIWSLYHGLPLALRRIAPLLWIIIWKAQDVEKLPRTRICSGCQDVVTSVKCDFAHIVPFED